MQRTALVCGAGGFIGSHLVKRLKREGFWVRGVDLKYPEFGATEADDFVIADLRDGHNCRAVVDRRFDEVYQLAADMGGAGYIFTGENDANVMHNSALINLNVLEATETALRSLAEEKGLKAGQLFMPIRVAVTGRKISPPLFESLELLGRESSLARIEAARAALATQD